MKSFLHAVLYSVIIGVFLLFQSQLSKAQNYFPLQLDSLHFFYGPAYSFSSPSMNPPLGSSYRVIKIDSITSEANNMVYHSIRSTRDTANAIFECIDVLGGSWLGNKIIHDSNQNLVFLNHKNDSIYLKYHANVGANWLFYSYPDNSKIVATVASISLISIFNSNDSLKKITLQYFNSLGQPAAHSINGKEIMLSKTYGAVALPDFYFFPEDSTILNRNFYMKRISNKEIYDFNVGDKYCYAQSYYSLVNPSPYYYDYYNYTIQNKFYSQNNEIVNYGRMVEFFDTEIIPGVGFNTTYNVSYDTISIILNEHLPLPEEGSLLTTDILESRMDSLFNRISLSTTANVAFFENNCFKINSFEPASHVDIYLEGLGLYKREHIYFGSGIPNMLLIKLVGYIKNGIQNGEIAALKDITYPAPKLIEDVFISQENLSFNYIPKQKGSIQIYDLQGQIVFSYEPIIHGKQQIILPILSSGIYILKVINEKDFASQKIFVGE